MDGNRIVDLPKPTTDSEPVTKGYAGKHYLGGGAQGPKGDKGDKGDRGLLGPQSYRGQRGFKGDKGDQGPQGPKGDKGDQGPQGPKGDKGDQGPQGQAGQSGPRGLQDPQGLTGQRGSKDDKGDQGPKRDKGDQGPQGQVGMSGPRGLQGPQGLTGPRGRKGDKGDQGPQGSKGDKSDRGTGGLTDEGFTMKADINMSGNEIVGLRATPSAGSASVSKNYTKSRYVRTNSDIDMNDHKVTNLEAPTTNTDAATKKYVDDKECKFKDGTTTTLDVDLRTTASGSEFYDDVTFKANAKCKDLNVLSTSDDIVNKNSLETGRLVGIESLSSTVRGLLTDSAKHELLVMKGKPTSNTIITRHHCLNGNPTLTADSDSVTLNISFNSDLPKGIYKYAFELHFSVARSINISQGVPRCCFCNCT